MTGTWTGSRGSGLRHPETRRFLQPSEGSCADHLACVLIKTSEAPRQIPRSAGESAGRRDDAELDVDNNAGFPLPEILKAIKGASSPAINRRLLTHEPVWQEESFDHVQRSSESLDAKIDYVLQNPVRAGLVRLASE